MHQRWGRLAAAAALTGSLFGGLVVSTAPPAGAVSGPLCSGVTAVAAGQTHAFALQGPTKAWGWGNNSKGQLTVSPNTSRSTPTPIDSLAGASALAAGSMFTVALFPPGTVKTAGANAYGQLGNGTVTDSRSLVSTGLNDVARIDAGGSHALALATNGTVWAWGRNVEGQLGDGTTTNRSTPTQVPGLTDVVSIAAGWNHSLALKSDGTVWAWGYNSTGQLGNGTKTSTSTPTQVSGITNATAIDAGTSFSLALLADKTLRSWGSNTSGQLGSPGGSRTTPSAITLANVTKIAAGNFHTLATTGDGKTYAWGSNSAGQLGTGTPKVGPPVGNGPAASSSTPVEVVNASGATAIEANGSSSYAIRAGGTLWAWGGNGSGQLGTGTTSNSYDPVQTGCPNTQQPLPWSLVLVAEPPVAAPGTPVVLHAVANQDVGPTPYAIHIFDNQTGLPVASCTSGSSCAGPVTSATPQSRTYTAYVASPSATAPPPFIQASATATVMWGPTGPGPYSGSCDKGTAVLDMTSQGTHAHLKFAQPSADETWVCFRVDNASAWVGGRIAVIAPDVTPSGVAVDDDAAACSRPGNLAPGPHPLRSGDVAGTPYTIDTYADATSASVCLTVGATAKRVTVQATNAPPALIPSLDGV